ncbi:hypothetical protein C3L33_06304, partial [Rhododendron williamsianum]
MVLTLRKKKKGGGGRGQKNEEDEEGGKGKGEEDNMLPLPKRPRNQTVDRISPCMTQCSFTSYLSCPQKMLCSNLKKFVLDFCFFRPEYFPEMDANLWIHRLSINSASLEKVVIQHSMSDQYVLEISAPKLLMLELMGDFERQKFQFANISSLVRVNLKFSGSIVWGIEGSAFSGINCKILTLNSHVLKWDIPGIVSLLQGSPYLEKLVVNMSSDYHHAQDDHAGFRLQLVQFLLQNAVALEKMVIKIGKSGRSDKCSASVVYFCSFATVLCDNILSMQMGLNFFDYFDMFLIQFPDCTLKKSSSNQPNKEYEGQLGRLWVGLRSCCLEVGIGADVVVSSTWVRSGVAVFPVSSAALSRCVRSV